MSQGLSRPIAAKVALALLTAALFFTSGIDAATANGGTRPLVRDARAGPYSFDVGIFPGRPKVGNFHLSILVKDVASGGALTNATVTVTLTGPEGSTAVGPVQAVNTRQTPRFYDVNVPLDLIGSWDLNLMADSHLGPASLHVPLEVTEATGIDLVYPLIALLGALAVLFWVLARMRSRRRGRTS